MCRSQSWEKLPVSFDSDDVFHHFCRRSKGEGSFFNRLGAASFWDKSAFKYLKIFTLTSGKQVKGKTSLKQRCRAAAGSHRGDVMEERRVSAAVKMFLYLCVSCVFNHSNLVIPIKGLLFIYSADLNILKNVRFIFFFGLPCSCNGVFQWCGAH